MANKLQLKWVLLGSLLTSIGMSFIWPLTSVYLHDDLKISLSVVGVILFFNSLASVVGNLVGGLLFDRKNPYYLLLFGGLFTVLSLVGLTFFHGWPIFGFFLFLVGLGSGWNTTMVSALGASLKDYDGRYVFNMIYFAQNLGVVLGSSLVGFVYSLSVTLLFIIATTLCFGYFVLAYFCYRPMKNWQQNKSLEKNESRKKGQVTGANFKLLMSFFVALFFIWVLYQQWVSNLSVYMTSLKIPLSHYSLLWTLNAGLIVLVQLVLVQIGSRIKGLFSQIYFGLVMVTLSFVVLIFAKAYWGFVVAMAVLTLGEATAFPAIPALINRLAPENAKGRYLGFANSFASAGRALGPLFGGIVIDLTSYKFLFEVAAGANFIILGLVIFISHHLAKHLKFYRD